MNMLLNEINADIENGNFTRIEVYKKIMNLLQEIFSTDYLKDIHYLLNELESNAEAWHTYQGIKEDCMNNDISNNISDEIAWGISYC